MINLDTNVRKFHLKSVDERQEWLISNQLLEENVIYENFGSLGKELTDRMIENTIGIMEIPLGIAMNFIVNGRNVVIPMATEESSVIAAASYAAKLTRSSGGFTATSSDAIMIGQIQILNCRDPFGAKMRILEHKDDILQIAREQDPLLIQLGGGPRDIEVRVIDDAEGPIVVVHLSVHVLDAMGANIVNTMAESIAPTLERISRGRVYLRIISNLADKRLARGRCIVRKEELGEPETVNNIVNAYRFAAKDPYRAATHNKGIMNGISAVVLATGNDTRAVEAGAHAYAARSGQYTSLSTWEINQDGNLVGTLELPLAVGITGGITSIHPKAKENLKILKVKSARQLAEIIVSVGLAQNFAALRALVTEGIQKGHMNLHAKNIAIQAGATGSEIDQIAEQLVLEGKIRLDRAKQLFRQLSDK